MTLFDTTLSKSVMKRAIRNYSIILLLVSLTFTRQEGHSARTSAQLICCARTSAQLI